MSKLCRQLFNLLLLSTITMMIYIHKSSSNEFTLPTVDMVRNHGYLSAQIYKVTTSDNYVLELHRIPKGRKGKEPFRNYPVLLPNILMGSSADWVIGGPDSSLPEQLADDGYDVWLGNYRGNTYSREHKEYSNKEYKFWDFSMHELGVKDLPAIIDFILNETNTEKLHFIGYSMSTTIFFIMASEEPVYQNKIQTSIMLAPVANILHTKSSAKYFAPMAKTMNALVRVAHHGEFLSYRRRLGSLLIKMCNIYTFRKFICLRLLIYSSCGKDPYYFNESLIPLIFGHYPAGTSSKLIQHYSQSITTDGFYQYDYGPTNNLKNYGSKYPPPYKLNNVKVPTFIFHADNDFLAVPKDVENLLLQLPNVVKVIKVDNKYFNHADFLFSTHVTELVNNPIKDILEEAENPIDQYTSKSSGGLQNIHVQ